MVLDLAHEKLAGDLKVEGDFVGALILAVSAFGHIVGGGIEGGAPSAVEGEELAGDVVPNDGGEGGK